jgi:hypothetical protein
MNYSFVEYEAAVLAALESLKVAQGGSLAALEANTGQVQPTDEGLLIFSGQFPAVLVEVDEADYHQDSIAFLKQTVTVNLYVVAQNWRGQGDARGAAFTILADLRRLLLNNTLGLEIRKSGLELAKEKKLYGDLKMVIFLVQYKFYNDRIAPEGET